jgi:hypothetical protein
MPIAGQRETSNVAQTQRVIDVHKPILRLEPDAAPITVITKQYRNGSMRQRATDPKFTWHNSELEQRFDAINNVGGYTNVATSIVVDNGSRFAIDDIVKVPRTGEVLLVTNVVTNTLTVVRGAGASSGVALVDDDPLYIIGTAAEEGSRSQVARSENPVVETNYTQVFKTSLEASGTWLSSSNESSPHDWNFQAKTNMIEHLKDIEGAFLFGAPGEETGANGKKQRVTGGLLYYMTANNVAAGGAWTLSEVNSFLGSVTRYGSREKVLFVGRTAASVLDEHALNKLQVTNGADSFGVGIKTWQSTHGEFKVVVHNMLEGAVYGGYAIAVDFKSQALAYRYLNGDGPGGARDTHVMTNREESDRDGKKDEILSECGLQVGLPKAGGVATGIATAS